MVKADLQILLKSYKNNIEPNSRFSSFDYCYNYFYSHSANPKRLQGDMEKSCLTLGFYLASWGMFRGSGFLLNKSVKYFESTINFISEQESSLWNIDANTYKNDIDRILKIYDEIKSILIADKNIAHMTLVTKVMLGVFGFIPAYDQNFCKAFREMYKGECGFRVVNKKSLTFIYNFYLSNQDCIDNYSKNIKTLTFNNNASINGNTSFHYPKAKIIDMCGFEMGKNL